MAAIMASDVDFGDNVYIEGVGYMPTEMYAQHLRMQGIEPNQKQSEYLTVQEYLGKDGFNNAVNPEGLSFSEFLEQGGDTRMPSPQVMDQIKAEMDETPTLDDSELPSRLELYQQTIKDPDKNLIPGIKDEYLIVGTIIAVIFLV